MSPRSLLGLAFVMASCAVSGLLAQQPVARPAQGLDANAVRATVTQAADLVGREYMDQAAGERVAQALRRRLADGEYVNIATSGALATQLTRDLLAESQDKHLAVTLARGPAPSSPAPAAANMREIGVRRTNAGIQRVEILSGNVGYLTPRFA